MRPDAAWESSSERRANTWGTWAFIAIIAGNVVVGSVGYLHAIMLVLFAGPASIFATGIKEIFDDAYREAKQARM